MPLAYRILDRLFPFEDIGSGRGEPYMRRWILGGRRNGSRWYLHHFVGSDWTRDLHDHPAPFLSIGLCGRYVEVTPVRRREWRAPWIRQFPATHRHRIEIRPGETVWTLVHVGENVREWGFWAPEWVYWRDYLDRASTPDEAA